MLRHGEKWTQEEDKKLKSLFNNHKSFYEMSIALDRTWFACKCRLVRLGLIGVDSRDNEFGFLEKYRVPNLFNFNQFQQLNDLIEEQPIFKQPEQINTNNTTFSDDELVIISAYLKSRYSKISLQLMEDHCFVKKLELEQAKQILEDEIRVVNSIRKMSTSEREKFLHKIC